MTVRAMVPALTMCGMAAFAADDPVVEAAKKSTRVAVHKTRQGSVETAKAVKSWVKPDPTKPSASAIAEAKKSGLVWADHEKWTYYKDGADYGKTANGEFWSETEAKSAGYKPAEIASK